VLKDLDKLASLYDWTNKKQRVDDINTISEFYKKTVLPFKNTMSNIYAKIDGFLTQKNVLVRKWDKVTPVRVSQLKEAVFNKSFTEFKNGKDPLDIENEWTTEVLEKLWVENYAPDVELIKSVRKDIVPTAVPMDEEGNVVESSTPNEEEAPTINDTDESKSVVDITKEAFSKKWEAATDWLGKLMYDSYKKSNPPAEIIELTLTGDKQQSTQIDK
jgi:hypothetical protein